MTRQLKRKALLDDIYAIQNDPERQKLPQRIAIGGSKREPIKSGIKIPAPAVEGVVGATIGATGALGAEAAGIGGVGAMTAFSAQTTWMGAAGAAAYTLAPPALGVGTISVGAHYYIKSDNKAQKQHDMSAFLELILHGKITKHKHTWLKSANNLFSDESTIYLQDKEKWKCLLTSKELANLDYEDQKKIIDQIPPDPKVIEQLTYRDHFDQMVQQHYATVYCKILQIYDEEDRKNTMTDFKEKSSVKKFIEDQDQESINLDYFKAALNIALKGGENSLYPLHKIWRDIEHSNTDEESRWDFLDLKCEELISQIDQKGILNYDPQRDVRLGETQLNYFQDDVHNLTRNFYNFYHNGKIVDPKTDPDHKLRQALSYSKEYQKAIRKVSTRLDQKKKELEKERNQKKKELEQKINAYPEYVKQKKLYERDQKRFYELYQKAPETPEEIQKLQDEWRVLEKKYQGYTKRPPHVQVGLNIARKITENIKFNGNRFMFSSNVQKEINIADKLFQVSTNQSLDEWLTSALDDVSIEERKERLRKIFNTNEFVTVDEIDINDLNAELHRLDNPATNPDYKQNPQDVIARIKTPQQVLEEFLKTYGNNDPSLSKLSAGGLAALTDVVLNTAFDNNTPSKSNFNLLIKFINKLPKKIFEQGGFFSDKKTDAFVNIITDLLDLELDEPATELMQALLPKVSPNNLDKFLDTFLDDDPSLLKLSDDALKALSKTILNTSLNGNSSSEYFNLLIKFINKLPKEIFSQGDCSLDNKTGISVDIISNLLKSNSKRPASALMQVLLPKINTQDLNSFLDTYNDNGLPVYNKNPFSFFRLSPFENEYTYTTTHDKEKSLLNIPFDGLQSLIDTILDKSFVNGVPSAENFNLLTKLINKAPKEMFTQNGFFASEKTRLLTSKIINLLELGLDKTATELMKALFPKINPQNMEQFLDSYCKNDERLLRLSDTALKELSKNVFNIAFEGKNPSENFNLLIKLVDKLSPEITIQENYSFDNKKGIAVDTITKLLDSNLVQPATELMKVLLPKINSKDLEWFLDSYEEKDPSLLKLSHEGLETLTGTILERTFKENIPSTENLNLLTKLINKAPKEMFTQNGFFASEKTRLLTSKIVNLLELGHDKPATELMQALLPKLNPQDYSGGSPIQRQIFDNISRLTVLSIDRAQNEDMSMKEPLNLLLYQAKKDIYKTSKNHQALLNHPVLYHMPEISRLALQNLDNRNYQMFGDLVDMVRISNKYDQDGHRQISTDTVFGNHASPLMNKLIEQSTQMFGTHAKKQILAFLKICKHSDFSTNGILGNSLEQLKHYTDTANPDTQKAIFQTNFGRAYNNVFNHSRFKIQRNLQGLKNQFNKTERIKKWEQREDFPDDASFSSLDSGKVRVSTSRVQNTQRPYSNRARGNMTA